MASTNAEDSALQTSADEPGVVEFVAILITSEATRIIVPEVSATISVSTELLAQRPFILVLMMISSCSYSLLIIL